MKVLVTSSRMPFALGMIRKLAAAGHEVYAADDYSLSPGSHSEYVAAHFVYLLVTPEGLSFVECNPRPTDGVLLMPRDQLARGLLDPSPECFVLGPGGRVQLDLAVLADGFADHLHRLPESIRDLAQLKDAGSGWHDPMPTLYSALAIGHFAGQSLREHKRLFEAMAGDMNWDGQPIDGMSQADANLLTRLRPS